jgi:Fe-S oxidoreductase
MSETKRVGLASLLPNGRQNPEYQRLWRELNPEKIKGQRRRHWWRRSGLNVKEAEEVYASSTTCMICGNPITDRTKQVDHDHKTGKIRGILCRSCNLGLGYFRDDLNLLRQASNYLSMQTNGDIR